MLKEFKQEEFDIIIQAGQSNSEGTGFGSVENPYSSNDKVWYMNGDFTILQACEAVYGNWVKGDFSLSFANEYIKKGMLQDGRKLLILRTSVGGTGFLNNCWGMTDVLYLRMLEMTKTALELNKKNKLIALLWHQGETDAILSASYETHYANLLALLLSIREKFDCPNLPFVAGDFVKQWKEQCKREGNIFCEPVLEAMKDVCKNNPCCAFVTTDELVSNAQENYNEDTIHFSRDALYKLGVKYFEALMEIMSCK